MSTNEGRDERLIYQVEKVQSIEDRRNSLIMAAEALRIDISKLLNKSRAYRVGIRSSLFRKKLRRFDNQLDKLQDRFAELDQAISLVTTQLAVVEKITFADGSTKPVHLGNLMAFAIQASNLNSTRETVRAVLHDLENSINNKESQANNLVATGLAVIALITSVILSLIQLLIEIYSSSEVQILWLPSQQ